MKERFALSAKQRDDLLQTSRSCSFLHELMIETQLLTGMRVGELVNLRISDVDLIKNTIKITQHNGDNNVDDWKPKTEFSERLIPIDSGLSLKLSNYLKKVNRANGYVFTSQKGSAFKRESVIGFINKYARNSSSIGFNIGSHVLRRTFASFMLSDNRSIWKISKLLGHSSIQFTIVYLFRINKNDNDNEIRESQAKMIAWKDKV